MSTPIINGAPLVNFLGTDDQSGKIVRPEREQIPQFLVKGFILSPKGTLEPTIINGKAFGALFGDEVLDKTSKYFHHQVKALTKPMENSFAMIQRVVPADATPAKATLCAVVETVTEDIYKRNADGSIVTDAGGVKQKDVGNAHAQSKISFIVKDVADGTILTAGTGEKIYPIVTIPSYERGSGYNDVGFGIGSIPATAITSKYITEKGYIPYNFFMYERVESQAKKIKTLFGSDGLEFSFRRTAKQPYRGTPAFLETTLIDAFFNLTDTRIALRAPTIKEPAVYDATVETLLKDIAVNEKPLVTAGASVWADGGTADPKSWFDYPDAAEMDTKYIHLINFLTAKSIKGIDYMATQVTGTYTPVAGEKLVNVGQNAPIFLEGGTDGTIDNATYEALVRKELLRYADPYDEVLDMAYNVESTFVDSGFSLATKKVFPKVLSIRPDTNIIFSTVDQTLDSKKEQTVDEMKAMADAILTTVKLYPESEYFGTKVMRAVIIGGNGEVLDNSFDGRISQNYEMLGKLAAYMGAGNGKWKAIGRFDNAPGNIVESMKELSPKFIPDVVKPVLFDTGLVWTQRYNRRLYHFPQFQTVYDDSTSVLNGAFTMFAICTLQKIGAAAQREYTGSSRYSKAQLAERVIAFVNNRVDGIFDDSFVIIPKVTFTDLDDARGYSWELSIEIGGSNMFTVETLKIVARRAADIA